MPFKSIVILASTVSRDHAIDEIPESHAPIRAKSFKRTFTTASPLKVPTGIHDEGTMVRANDCDFSLRTLVIHFIIEVGIAMDFASTLDEFLS